MLASPSTADAAEYPPHETIDVLVVSDGVNPHGLPAADRTQPGEISTSLLDPAAQWGLSLGAVDEVDSGCIDEALDILAEGEVDVIIYFAHLGSTFCAGGSAEPELTEAFEAHLETSGGIVVFHHGIFSVPAKQGMPELLGGTAGEFEWHPIAGQRVINVAPEHFVTSHDVDYDADVEFGWAAEGLPQQSYASVLNAPDERYPQLESITAFGESRTLLFASDYDGPQQLGYDLQRPNWLGHVVMYQPGEYQPNALDNADGANRQIFGNAIYFASGAAEDEPESTSTGDGTTGGESGDTSTSGRGSESSGSSGDGTDTTRGGSSRPEDEPTPTGSEGTDSGTDSGTDGASGTETEIMPHFPPPSPVPWPEGVIPKASVQGSCSMHSSPISPLAWLVMLAATTRTYRRKRRRRDPASNGKQRPLFFTVPKH